MQDCAVYYCNDQYDARYAEKNSVEVEDFAVLLNFLSLLRESLYEMLSFLLYHFFTVIEAFNSHSTGINSNGMESQYAFKFIDTYNQDFKDLNCVCV